MDGVDQNTNIREVLTLLERALELLDEMKHHAAAAQLDNVIHLVQGSTVGEVRE